MEKNTLIGLAVAFCTLIFVLLPTDKDENALPSAEYAPKAHFSAHYGTPLLDGNGQDEGWQKAPWLPLDQVWIGAPPTPEDFSGRYKMMWDENNLYILAEITDDALVDTHPDGLEKYWDDDCLEIFVDEDASGGDHQYNYNAFAYHIALDGKVTDTNPDKAFAYFNDHCVTRRNTVGQTTTWEVAVKIFDGKHYEDGAENIPKMLSEGKKMGFALAYCDNDRSAERENFIGNVAVAGEDKNRGWIDAGIFGLLSLEQ